MAQRSPTTGPGVAIADDVARGETVLPARIRGRLLLWEGRIEEARRSILEADRHLVEAGLELMRHDTLSVLSEVECAAGSWEGYDIIVHAGLEEIRDQMLSAKAHVASLTGRDVAPGAKGQTAFPEQGRGTAQPGPVPR